jgi:DNA-directed RNA polymerase specialized sigma24 family protein
MAFYLDGFATSEIAAELGITEQQVREVMKKARAMLRRALAATTEGMEQ